MYANDIAGGVVVISDLHGAYSETKALLGYLAKEKIIDDKWVVFIGDYVDQGPETAKTIEFILSFAKYHKNTTFLAGNHDLNLIKALNLIDNPHQEFYWNRIPQRNMTTLRSYGAANGQELLEKMPENHKNFFRNLVWSVNHPEYFFVHLGLDKYQSFDKQEEELIKQDIGIFKPKWLYNDSIAFHDPQYITDKTVVSGHTILNNIYETKSRIMIDTGCGYGGCLTAVSLPEREYYQCRITANK
jgi:serine/threonine protein phosphatase 1